MPALTPDELGALLTAHGPALRLFARQWCDAADDVVQEAFVRLAAQAESPRSPAAWLFRVVRNGALDARRRSLRRRRHETGAAGERRDWFESRPEAAVDGRLAAAALAELDEALREVIVAHVWGGLTFDEIGELIEASSSTAHRRYEQGLKLLRERMEQPCRTENR